MKTEKFKYIGSGGTMLPAVVWLPEGEVKAVLQVAHGMTEHIGRYEQFAEVMTSCGIAVAGFDLRGHGQNAGDDKVASFGENGWATVLEDMHLFAGYLHGRFANAKHFMLGFSLGSFLLREYLGMFKEHIDGAIILGTGNQPGVVLNVMLGIVKTQFKENGFDGTTPLVQKLSFDTYNQKFKPNRTSADWLCSDVKELDLYREDALCREHISAGLFWQLLSAMKRTGTVDYFKKWNSEVPVLILSGQQDPVGDFGKGVRQVEKLAKKAGIKQVATYLLPEARHDVLHEEASGAAEQAHQIIKTWILEN